MTKQQWILSTLYELQDITEVGTKISESLDAVIKELETDIQDKGLIPLL